MANVFVLQHAHTRDDGEEDVKLIVVLDNAGMHSGRLVKAARRALAQESLFLCCLPPYSPELNRIGAVFKQVKRHEMPVRSHAGRDALRRGGRRRL